MGVWEWELYPHFILSKGIVFHMDHSAILLFGRTPVSQDELLSRPNFHSKRDERSVSIHDQSRCVFFQRRFAVYLRANEDRNPQDHPQGPSGIGTLGERTL